MAWKKVKLEKISILLRNGANIKQNDSKDGFPITRIETIANGNINPFRMGYAGIVDCQKYKNYFLQDGDILISHINSEKHLGKCAIFKNRDDKFIHGMNLLMLRLDKEVADPTFINYFLKSCYFINQLPKITKKSVNQASIAIKDLKEIEVPLPPIEIQIKIAEALDKAQEFIDNRKLQLEKYDELIQSTFIDMFGDPVTNPKKWEIKRLKEISTKILSGNTPKGGSNIYTKTGIPFFRSQNIWRNRIKYDDIVYIDETIHNSMLKSSLKNRDILITKTGRINTENSSLGRAAMFLGEDNKGNINGHVYLIRLKKCVADKFVLYIITTDKYREYIRGICVGAIDKRQINKNHLEEFPIINPPIELQNKFASILEVIENEKKLCEESLKQMEENFNSMIDKAFKGELF